MDRARRVPTEGGTSTFGLRFLQRFTSCVICSLQGLFEPRLNQPQRIVASLRISAPTFARPVWFMAVLQPHRYHRAQSLVGESHAQRPLAGLLSGRGSCCASALAARRRSGCVCRPGRKSIRDGQAGCGDHDRAVRHADALARFFTHCREGWPDRAAGAFARAAVPSVDAGSASRAPGVGVDHSQFRCQRPGSGQCRHAHRPARNASPAGAQSEQDGRQ